MKKILLILSVFAVCSKPLYAQLGAWYEPFRLYEDGLELFEKGKYGAADLKLETFLAKKGYAHLDNSNEINANARYYQAVCAYHLERNDAAPLLKSFINGFPENTKWVQAHYYLGRHYFDQKLFSEAKGPLQTSLEQGALPAEENYRLTFMLGYCHFIDGEYKEAIPFLDQAVLGEHEYVEDARYYRAIILYHEGNYGLAYDAFKELEFSAHKNDISIYLANCMLKLGKTDELFALADKLATDSRAKSNDAQVYFIVANAAYERENYIKATQYFAKYIKNRGELSRSGWFRYGQSHFKLDEFTKAIPIYQRVVQRTRDTLTQIGSYYLGFCFLEEDQLDNARVAFEKSAKSPKPRNEKIREDALYQYGRLCFSTRYYEEAYKSFRTLEKDYPNSPLIAEVQPLIGDLLFVSKNYKEAIKYFESLSRLSPATKKSYQKACFFYGTRLFDKEKYPEADKYLAKAVSLRSDPELNISGQYWLAESKFRQNKYAEAATAFTAFKRVPGASTSSYSQLTDYGLAWAYFKQKKYTSALKSFDGYLAKASAKSEPRFYVDALLRAGDCHFLKRNYSKSNGYYQRVISQNYTYMDYATYQIAEGAYRTGDYQGSVAKFGKLVQTYRRSELRDDALNRMSEIYSTWIKDYAKAKLYARRLVDDYPRSPLAPDAYNRLAAAAYYTNNEKEAIRNFKKVLEDYPSDQKNCQIALENLSSLLDPAEYDRVFKAYKARNPEVNQNMADLAFNTGMDRYYSGNYSSAVDQFSSYINDFPSGKNYHEALIFRARSFTEMNQESNALSDYEAVYRAVPKNNFTNVALLEAAELKYQQRAYDPSLQLFKQLEQTASKAENRTSARFGIAKCLQALGNFAEAERVLVPVADDPVLPEPTRQRARMEIGMSLYNRKMLDKALNTFQGVSGGSDTEYGARSQYMVARIFFDKTQYTKSKDAGLDLQNNYPTYNYWKAKGFLVIAQAENALGNSFQAKGTLESIINNAEFPDITKEAEDLLSEILAKEQGGN